MQVTCRSSGYAFLTPTHSVSPHVSGSGGSTSSTSRPSRSVQVAAVTVAVFAVGRSNRRRVFRSGRFAEDGDRVQVKDKQDEEETLNFDMPSSAELARQEMELLEASGAVKLSRKEEALQLRRQYRQENPSKLDQWSKEIKDTKRDTERRMLWGDLKRQSGDGSTGAGSSNFMLRYRGKRVGEEEAKIKWNRGFPLMDTPEQEQADQLQDRQWLDMWRSAWPEGEAIDPHDPESFGFSFVGEVIGAHGLDGAVKVRIDDDLYQTGFEFNDVLLRRAYSNWDENAKRVHLKAPHRRFPRAFRILKGFKVNNRIYGLRLNGVEDVNEAAQMCGYKVYTLAPPPTAEEVARKEMEKSVDDLYTGSTTTFSTSDAMELIGAKCVMVTGEADEDVLGEFAAAETSEEANEVLTAAGVETVTFGDLTAVVPDYRLNRRHKGRKTAHDLLDITIRSEVQSGEDRYLFEPDPNSLLGKSLKMKKFRPYDPLMDRVVYVPFAADLIARVDADDSGVTVYFTLPPNYLQATSFKCRKRIINDKGMLAIPRASPVRALLPPAGKSHALRRRDGKNLPLHGTAPAAPLDMPMIAGEAFPEPSPGVPRPPLTRPFGGIGKDGRKRDVDFLRNMKRRIKEQRENKVAEDDFRRK